jgi:hypothetical protein
VAGGYQEDHREGVPQPVGNVAMQGEPQHPRYIDAPNYDAAYYRPPPPRAPPVSDSYLVIRYLSDHERT